MKTWAYGITTVPDRREPLLAKTKESLANAGFNEPTRIFVDGKADVSLYEAMFPGSGITIRDPRMGIFGNWMLGFLEMYIREPRADYYAIFQDDIILCKNLRQYLEQCDYPYKGYLNLYTMPENLLLSGNKKGWYYSNQRGRGGLALVFNHEAAMTLGSQFEYILTHPLDRKKGTNNEDGVIVTAMGKAGWKEYVHNPSLVQHVGRECSTFNVKRRIWPDADSFPGEGFDATQLLQTQAQ